VHELIASTEIHAEEIVSFCGGIRKDCLGDRIFRRVCTDSRRIEGGDLFLALRGPRFDGHGFINEALEKGASGLVVEHAIPQELCASFDPVLIEVKDTFQALGDMAAGWRKKFPIPVGVLTGSNGKTTTKEMAAGILGIPFRLLWSRGNFNNLIGLSLTLLELHTRHERVLLEMGMNRPGEIGRLTWIAQPQVGVLLNVAPAHMERFRDIRDIAAAKGEMLEVMHSDALLVFNYDDPLVRELAKGWKGSSLSFGTASEAGVRLIEAEDLGEKQRVILGWDSHKVECLLQVAGIHNRHNALAAAAIATAMGADQESVYRGLSAFQGVSGRFSVVKADRYTLIDDTYNANPRSMECALENLMHMSRDATRMAVLGDMLELGSYAHEAHRALGTHAARTGLSHLVLIGNHAGVVREGALGGGMGPDQIHIAADSAEAAQWIYRVLKGGEWILVKGSRGMQMEKVIHALETLSGYRGSK